MDKRARELIEQGDKLWTARRQLDALWQETAENFYPQRSDFTRTIYLGEDLASDLYTSYPLLVRRDMEGSFLTMLQPNDRDWFYLKGRGEDLDEDDEEARQWLDAKTSVQKRLMVDDHRAKFQSAMRELMGDFSAFGQGVIEPKLSAERNHLLFRTWHLRDVVWCEDVDRKISVVHRKQCITARDLVKLFPETAHEVVRTAAEREPYREFKCRHIKIQSDDYDMGKKARKDLPWVSLWVDVDNQKVLEETAVRHKGYVIPRWQLMSGSQYAFSPAVIAALPEGRMIQAQAAVLLDAGEKAVAPPMVAYKEAIRGDIALYANGVTYIDRDYDEKTGDPLRPLRNDTAGLPFGMDLIRDSRAILMEAFYINKLKMPQMGENPNMTAFEAGQRVQEYIREALPLMAPLEPEVNGQICDEVMELLLWNGAFGPLSEIPESLQGVNIRFGFRSPLRDSVEAMKPVAFQRSAELLAMAAQMDPVAPQMIDARKALRDALHGVGAPAKWLKTEDEMDGIADQVEQQQAAAALMGLMNNGAQVAATAGQAAHSFAQADAVGGQA